MEITTRGGGIAGASTIIEGRYKEQCAVIKKKCAQVQKRIICKRERRQRKCLLLRRRNENFQGEARLTAR